MKYIIQDATRENEHRIRRQKALELSKTRDRKDETIAAIFFPALSLILSITGVCVILLNVDLFDGFPSWFNSLTWVENLFWELPALALGLWWVIKRSGK